MTSLNSDILTRTDGDKRRLENFGYKVYSQSDEDGIIDEIFTRIGVTNRVFVEIGVESGKECNTRHLLNRGWSGLWIEGFPQHADSIRQDYSDRLSNGQLKLQGSYVNADNINELIEGAGITGEIDLFSLDIDSNDYHVLNSLDVIRPRVIMLEHNHTYPPPLRYVMPRNDSYRWSAGKSDFGASLTSLTELAASKGYTIVGCGLYSPNSFHVRSDLVLDRFSGPFTPEHFWNPLDAEKVFSYPRAASEFSDQEIARLRAKLEANNARSEQLKTKARELSEKVQKAKAEIKELQRKKPLLRRWLGRVLRGSI